MAGKTRDKSGATPRSFNVWLTAAFLAISIAGVGLVSRYALLSVFLDSLAAAVVVIPPVLAGLWLVPLFRAGRMPLRWHLLAGALLGLGATSLLVLVFGLIGMLQRPVWMGIMVILATAGVVRLRSLLRRGAQRDPAETHAASENPPAMNCLWLLAAPFMSLALLAASNAPGFIWKEEGYGYDVLEYHLEMPKEYYQTGRIEYAPHNVYANFPANVEMLYLLAMILLEDDIDIGTTANMIHLLLGLLTVYAAWVIGKDWSPRAGIVCAIMMASAGWLCYLCGLAYVENGMLLFGMAGAGALLRMTGRGEDATGQAERAHSWSWAALTGGPPPPDGWPTSSEVGDPMKHPSRLRASPALAPGSQSSGAPGPKDLGHPLVRGAPGRSLSWITLAGAAAGLACGCKYTAMPMIALPLGLVALCLSAAGLRRRITCGLVFTVAALLTFFPWLVKNQVMTGNPVFPLANRLFQAAPPGWGEDETERWDRGHAPDEHERTIGARLGALWHHVPGDHYQRFGPVVILLALGGLAGRRRDRTDWALVGVLVIQLGVWLFATHLYARFAVVLLIPLTLLAGRAMSAGHPMPTRGALPADSASHSRIGAVLRSQIVIALIIVGCAWNFAFAAKLHRDESPGGAPASLIYDGHLVGFEYLHVIKSDLPQNAKILLVGDARAFYFTRRVDYCVVFNRNPFVEAIRAAETDHEIIEWLHDQSYTHILVNFSEINRLRNCRYGFAPEVNADLFERLTAHGLIVIREFEHPDRAKRDRDGCIMLYERSEF